MLGVHCLLLPAALFCAAGAERVWQQPGGAACILQPLVCPGAAGAELHTPAVTACLHQQPDSPTAPGPVQQQAAGMLCAC